MGSQEGLTLQEGASMAPGDKRGREGRKRKRTREGKEGERGGRSEQKKVEVERKGASERGRE